MISINIAIAIMIIIMAAMAIMAGKPKADADAGGAAEANIRTLLRQTARWSAASSQDESPIVALLHANYGAGYLWALKDIATGNEIKKATGVEINEFEKKIISIQDMATKKVSGLCPQFYSKLNTELLVLGGDL
jgi:hypothetical protein